MKRMFIRLTIGIVLLVLGFVGGRLFQHAKTGYHYEVLEAKEYGLSKDPVHWSYVTESVGLPFLDPGTTIIEYRGRTIYKAKRYFQENFPFAENIKTSDKSIEWDDGELSFHLTIDEMKKEPNK